MKSTQQHLEALQARTVNNAIALDQELQRLWYRVDEGEQITPDETTRARQLVEQMRQHLNEVSAFCDDPRRDEM